MSGHTFSYRSIHPVYTIVLIEKSSRLFSEFPDQYIHRFSQKSDTGLSMELLHHYIFIPLDIFKKKHQNENISTELEAWLTFLSTEEPGEIMQLCDAYSFFRDIYKHIYEICQNTEDVMGIFSEALTELDRNTVDYMIDQLKKSNEQLQGENEQLRSEKEQIQQQAKNDKELLQDEIARLKAELNKVKKQHE